MRVRLRWILVSLIGALTLALVWPAGAGRIAIVVIVGIGAVLALPALHSLAHRIPPAQGPDLVPGPQRRRTPQKPNHLISLERLLSSSTDDPTAPLPYAIRDQLRRHTRRRLADHHRLDTDEPRQQAQVVALLSPQLWYLVQPQPRDQAGRPVNRQPIASSWLPRLLDEIEAL